MIRGLILFFSCYLLLGCDICYHYNNGNSNENSPVKYDCEHAIITALFSISDSISNIALIILSHQIQLFVVFYLHIRIFYIPLLSM